MLEKLKYVIIKENLKTPISLIVFVTDRCNSRCLHCFNWKNLNKGNELSLDEIKRFSENFDRLLDVGFSGGEPFLRDDIDMIYNIFSKKTPRITIPTNGLIPNIIYEKTKLMLQQQHNTKLTISLSLDGTERLHDKIRGVKGNFKKVLETYSLLDKLKEDYDLRITVNTTISNKNINNISKLSQEVKKKMPNIDYHDFEIMRGYPKGNIKAPDIKDLIKLRPTIFEIWDGYSYFDSSFQSRIANMMKRYTFDLYIQILKKKKQLIPCFAGTVSCVLDERGNVYFCELLKSIGNIRKQSFKEIWNSKEAKKMREHIKNKKCYCIHSCFQPKNVMFNYHLYRDILKF